MCNCVDDITKKMHEAYDGKFKKPIESVQFQTAFNITTGAMDTYLDIKFSLVGQKKEECVIIAHTFCPFCGENKRKEQE